MSEAGYSDYYAEDLSRRVNAQTKGIVDPDGEQADAAEESYKAKQPQADDGEPQPASRAPKTGQAAGQGGPANEEDETAQRLLEVKEQPAEGRKSGELDGEIPHARSTSRSILKVPRAASSSESP